MDIRYPAILTPEPDGRYLVHSADFDEALPVPELAPVPGARSGCRCLPGGGALAAVAPSSLSDLQRNRLIFIDILACPKRDKIYIYQLVMSLSPTDC
jgi:hypothetical protein